MTDVSFVRRVMYGASHKCLELGKQVRCKDIFEFVRLCSMVHCPFLPKDSQPKNLKFYKYMRIIREVSISLFNKMSPGLVEQNLMRTK